jgi:hypothetical protein
MVKTAGGRCCGLPRLTQKFGKFYRFVAHWLDRISLSDDIFREIFPNFNFNEGAPMKIRQNHFALSLIGAAVMALTACGGGGGGGTTATGPLSTTVMDGLIQNALVCVDANNNGLCDPGEIQGRTDANGQVTLNVPLADIATAKLVARARSRGARMPTAR